MKTLSRGVYLLDRWEGPRFQIRLRIGKSNRFQSMSFHSEEEVASWLESNRPDLLKHTNEIAGRRLP